MSVRFQGGPYAVIHYALTGKKNDLRLITFSHYDIQSPNVFTPLSRTYTDVLQYVVPDSSIFRVRISEPSKCGE